jgi:hypothetical protein
VPAQHCCGRDDAAGPQGFGSSRDRAANTARPAQLSRGRGLARRSTTISWPSASISASFDAEDRASSASQDNPWATTWYNSRAATAHRSSKAAHQQVKATGRILDQDRPHDCRRTRIHQ